MSILKIKDLVHKYVTYGDTEEDKQEIAAINHIDINVEKGEFVAILGKNGSGKSSLAKHINGLLMPTEGAVYIKGMDTKDESTLLNVRQSAGIVFQNPDNQIVGTTVEEDTAFGPENLGVEPKDIWTRITAALTGVGMMAYKEASPNHLSGGQKQRVAIAGIMAEGRRHVLSLVKALNKEKNITILMVTHHMEEVILADRIIVMDQGKIVMDGKPKEIFSRVDEMKALGLEVPYATELAWELKKEGVNLSDTITTKEELVEELCQFV